MERMMKVQEMILKALAGCLKWSEAADIIGASDRTRRWWQEHYQEGRYDEHECHASGVLAICFRSCHFK
jgi:hypothetical protein